MRVENFHWEECDHSLNEWASKLLGVERFSPDSDRLNKYFTPFKETLKNIPIITIAGTNGKGQSCLLLEEYLLQAGMRPLLWSSPHILSVRERFSFEGKLVRGEKLMGVFKENEKLAGELTFYEFLFFCFCELAKEYGDDEKAVLIFEVGLGGRLDAVNFFDADLCAVTSIGRDHVEFLGSSLKGILHEKLGVSRQGKPLVSGVTQSFLREELASFCEEKEIPLQLLPLKEEATFQERNEWVSRRLFDEFMQGDKIEVITPDVLWARPFKVTYQKQEFTLVGSHNLDGLRSLAHWVSNQASVGNLSQESCAGFDEVWVGMSRSDEEDIFHCLELIKNSPCMGQRVRLFEFDHPRATSLEKLRSAWNRGEETERKVSFETDFKYLFENSQRDQRVLVCGSYYFIGALLHFAPVRERLYQ